MLAPPLLVRAGYPDLIRNTPGLVAYWRLRDLASSTVFRNELTTVGATMTGTPTPYQGTPIADGAGAKFNGTSQALSGAIDLSGYAQLSISFWLWVDSGSANDGLALEYTAAGLTGSFTIDTKESSLGGFSVGTIVVSGGTKNWWDYFTRPSADKWHHYLLTINRATPVNAAYVDGVAQTLSTGAHNAATYGNFANSTLNFMARNHASLWVAGRLSEVALYGGVILTNNDARNHYQSGVGW